MPVKVKKVDGFQVSTPGGVKAKSTTKAKAQRQANLLRAVEHGWKPTGAPAKDIREKKHHSASMGEFHDKRSKL